MEGAAAPSYRADEDLILLLVGALQHVLARSLTVSDHSTMDRFEDASLRRHDVLGGSDMSHSYVVYLRTRPSEPEVSAGALAVQRAAVQAEVGSAASIIEFIEAEGDSDDQDRPAYRAAWQLVSESACGDGPVLIIATREAIGGGQPFISDPIVLKQPGPEPSTVAEGRPPEEPRYVPLVIELDAPLHPDLSLIEPPAGAPAPICLYADPRPGQLRTLIYLCNTGSDILRDVTVHMNEISIAEFYRSRGPVEQWVEADDASVERWENLEPGSGLLLSVISHTFNDVVEGYVLRFTDAAGVRRKLRAISAGLSAASGGGAEQRWVAFRPCLAEGGSG